MSLDVSSLVTSPQSLKALILQVQKYASWYNQALIKMKATKTEAGQPPDVGPAAAGLIRNWSKDNQLSQKSLDELIETLKKFEAEAKVITVTLAAPAPAEMKNKITDWCRKNIDSKVLVNFKYKSAILGGMVVSWGSHVYDWSFRRQIMAAKAKFPEVLRSV